jgi:hypothetical protein
VDGHRLLTAARWPVGLAWTAFAYVWRIIPVHRRELEGDWSVDRPPELTGPVDLTGVQSVEHGRGPYLRRRYRIAMRSPKRDAAGVMAEIQRDPNVVVPGGLAKFTRTRGDGDRMAVGDEYTVRMPGPWDGPIRVAERTPTSFRFVTLDGHIEAGHIEWRARDDDGTLIFEIESWSRPGDRLSHVMHHRLRMAKEVQLHMWTSVLEKVLTRYGGQRAGAIDIDTRKVDLPG